MNRIIFRICLFSLLSATATIDTQAQYFQGGLNLGLNAAQIDGDGDEGFGLLALNAGAFVARPILEDQLYWQLGIRYSGRGKYRGPGQFDRSTDVAKLQYVELPLSVHYFLQEQIQFEIGFAPDVLVREYYADETGPISPEYANDLRRFGLTVFTGAWYFPMDKLAVGVRYNYSAIPFYKFNAYAVRYRDSGFFHDVLSLNVKYYFLR